MCKLWYNERVGCGMLGVCPNTLTPHFLCSPSSSFPIRCLPEVPPLWPSPLPILPTSISPPFQASISVCGPFLRVSLQLGCKVLQWPYFFSFCSLYPIFWSKRTNVLCPSVFYFHSLAKKRRPKSSVLWVSPLSCSSFEVKQNRMLISFIIPQVLG